MKKRVDEWVVKRVNQQDRHAFVVLCEFSESIGSSSGQAGRRAFKLEKFNKFQCHRTCCMRVRTNVHACIRVQLARVYIKTWRALLKRVPPCDARPENMLHLHSLYLYDICSTFRRRLSRIKYYFSTWGTLAFISSFIWNERGKIYIPLHEPEREREKTKWEEEEKQECSTFR